MRQIALKVRARIWLAASVSLLAMACATTLDYEVCDDANTVCTDTNNNIVVE